MKAADIKFSGIFVHTPRLEVPLFQRPYVWGELRNWLPLWQDIRKAAEQVEGELAGEDANEDPPTYFLGAVVLQERPYRPRRLRSSFIIDGQQRLTTLQTFLAAARSVAAELGAHDTEAKFQDFVENAEKNINDDHPEDRHRLWPLPQDRSAFKWAVRPPGDRAAMPTKDNTIARARQWFEDELRTWSAESTDPIGRMSALQYAVEERLQLVQIVLERSDDPQVIFEALNYRGVKLDAADLVKNLLFQTVDQQGHHHLADELLMGHWLPLDSEAWRREVTTGRIRRAQVDLLLSYWLTISTGVEILVEHLFADFKTWLKQAPAHASEVIKDIRRHADSYNALRELDLTTRTGQLIDRLDATQTSTPWPVLLYLQAAGAPEAQRELAASAIDSFLMRRYVCGLTTKDYNRLFLQVLNQAKAADVASAGQAVINALDSQSADSRYWPGDDEFRRALVKPDLYTRVVRARLRALLVGLENYLRTDKTEPSDPLSARDARLNIEHVLPQSWEKNWSLPGASDARIERRGLAIHMLGNLTVTTKKLNASLSHGPWSTKRGSIQAHSLLRLTTASILSPPGSVSGWTMDDWASEWDEERIKIRGEWLAEKAIEAWPKYAPMYVASA